MATTGVSPVRVGVIGAGGWGRNLVRTLHDMGVLAGVADLAESARAGARSRTSVPTYRAADRLLATDVDAIVVATPAVSHHAVARAALAAGKDVFVEKPLAMTAEDGEDLVRHARACDRVLMVGHLLLFQPAITWMRGFIADGSIGRVYSLNQDRLNLGSARAVENALWSLGVHDVAVLLHLARGTPLRTTAWGHCVLQQDIEDDVHLHLEFPGGLHAYQHSTWLWPEKRRRLTVVASEAMLVYDEVEQRVLLHNKGIDGTLAAWDRGSELVFRGEGDPLRLELEHFVRCVADRTRPLSDGESAVEVLRVLEYASALLRTGAVKRGARRA
jgi:predicted dehydrogenase